jgi:hypothetical protein
LVVIPVVMGRGLGALVTGRGLGYYHPPLAAHHPHADPWSNVDPSL